MFQEIAPHELKNQYTPREPKKDDLVFFYHEQKIILQVENGITSLPSVCQAKDKWQINTDDPKELQYLFQIDDRALFLSFQEVEDRDGFSYHNLSELRTMQPGWLSFAAVTAAHLAAWYENHKFCGRCAAPMRHKADERAVVCPKCGLVVYPSIAPVVIVGVTDGDRLLLTRYNRKHGGYQRYALNAGFVEIGEQLEDTVRREIMEDVGLKVKNIRYYKSQPWGFSNSILAGFFADVDGDTTIHIDPEELSEGVWFDRKDLPMDDTGLSLTWTMIELFRAGKEPKAR